MAPSAVLVAAADVLSVDVDAAQCGHVAAVALTAATLFEKQSYLSSANSTFPNDLCGAA